MASQHSKYIYSHTEYATQCTSEFLLCVLSVQTIPKCNTVSDCIQLLQCKLTEIDMVDARSITQMAKCSWVKPICDHTHAIDRTV